MTYEHYMYIVNKFNIKEFWAPTFYPQINISALRPVRTYNYCYLVSDGDVCIFDDLFSRRKAKQIINHIKETEVVFL